MKDFLVRIRELGAKNFFKWGYWTFALSFLMIQIPGCNCFGVTDKYVKDRVNTILAPTLTAEAAETIVAAYILTSDALTATQTATQTATNDATATEAARTTSIAATVSVILTETAGAAKPPEPDEVPAGEIPAEEESQPQQPDTDTSTEADEAACTIDVKQNLFCRPSPGYAQVDSFTAGTTIEGEDVVGISPDGGYAFVTGPNQRVCTIPIGGTYAELSSGCDLPVLTLMPTPTSTPTPTFTPTFTATATFTPSPTDYPTYTPTVSPTP